MPGLAYSAVDVRCLSHDGCIVDLGCLFWDWSRFFIGKKRVIGVDPYEKEIEGTELYKGIVCDETNKVSMSNNGVSSSVFNGGDDLVNALSWSDFCKKFNVEKISVLKINIEGSEYRLLRAMSQEDFEKIDQIAVSFHDWMNPSWRKDTLECLKILEKNDFSFVKIHEPYGWYLAIKNKEMNVDIILEALKNNWLFRRKIQIKHPDMSGELYRHFMGFSCDLSAIKKLIDENQYEIQELYTDCCLSILVGKWNPERIAENKISDNRSELLYEIDSDASVNVAKIFFKHASGGHRLDVYRVAIEHEGKVISEDEHHGYAGLGEDKNYYKVDFKGLKNVTCRVCCNAIIDGNKLDGFGNIYFAKWSN